jgi:hypothetical protein
MNVNGKMIPVEMRGKIQENVKGVNSSMIYLIYYKNFYKYYNVPPPSPTIKLKKKKYQICYSVSVCLCKWVS